MELFVKKVEKGCWVLVARCWVLVARLVSPTIVNIFNIFVNFFSKDFIFIFKSAKLR